jgi:hypothetical protein
MLASGSAVRRRTGIAGPRSAAGPWLLEEHPALLRLRTLQLAGQDSTKLRLTVSG